MISFIYNQIQGEQILEKYKETRTKGFVSLIIIKLQVNLIRLIIPLILALKQFYLKS